MKRQILILEDLESSRKVIRKMVEECGNNLLVYDFAEPAGAFQCAMDNKIDLFLVDIVLKPQEPNDFSGIKFAENIRENSRYTGAEIVFITTLAGLEADLLRTIHCFDYIEKPISTQRVQKVVHDALDKLDRRPIENELVYLRKDRVTYPVLVKDIIYVESRRKTLYVHKIDETFDVPNLSLKKFCEKIQSTEFIVPAKGFGVNVIHIEFVDAANRFVKMRGLDIMISIGERMKEEFFHDLYKFGNVGIK